MKEQKEMVEREMMSYYRDKKEKEVELVQLEKDGKIKELEGRLQLLDKQFKWQETTHDEAIDVEIRALNEGKRALEEQVAYFKRVAEEKDEQLRVAFRGETQEKILTLEKVIYQKDAELKTLKSCNFVKGMTGENVIMGFLKERYPKHEVVHTGKVAHEGDIHFINGVTGSLVVVESKYKQNITKEDVDKFCRDVNGVAGKEGVTTCVGGVFVSLLTRNIPGKGDVCFEMLGNVPVMFIGFSSVDEFNVYFGRYFEMFNEVCRFWKGVCGDMTRTSSLEELMDELNFYFGMLMKNKVRVDEFKTNCLTKLNKFVGDIENDNKVLLDRVEGLLNKNNSLRYGDAGAGGSSMREGIQRSTVHKCEKCGEVFSGKRLLTKHLKSCGV
jgi:hypothetical protein